MPETQPAAVQVPAVVPAPGNGALPPVLDEAMAKQREDRAAAAARKRAEAEFAEKAQTENAAARKKLIEDLGLDDESALKDLVDQRRQARAEEQAKTSGHSADTERRLRQLDAQIRTTQAEQAKVKDENAALRQQLREKSERELEGQAQAAVLKAVAGVAFDASQVYRLLAMEISVDAETGEIGVVDDKDEWRPEYLGAEGIAKYAIEFLKRPENKNLVAATSPGGAGSVGPTAVGSSQTQIVDQEKEVLRLRELQAKRPTTTNMAAYVAASTKLKVMKAAAQQGGRA